MIVLAANCHEKVRKALHNFLSQKWRLLFIYLLKQQSETYKIQFTFI